MPRKKVIPEENPEQVNDMEMEPQALEEGAEGMEQPSTADVPQEDVTSPAAGEEMDPPPGQPSHRGLGPRTV